MFINAHKTFEDTARFWTETYAKPETPHDEVRREHGWLAGGVAGWMDGVVCGLAARLTEEPPPPPHALMYLTISHPPTHYPTHSSIHSLPPFL